MLYCLIYNLNSSSGRKSKFINKVLSKLKENNSVDYFETKTINQAKQILLYSTILGPLGIAPYWLGMLGVVYGVMAVLLGVLFIGAAWRVMRDDSEKNCRQLFGFSIFYLFLLFFAMIVDRCVDFNPI